MKLRYYGTSGTPWIDRSVQAHQLLVNWNETQATCDVRLTGTSWALQYGAINGTDAKAAMESTTLFKVNEFPVWKNWDLTTLTQNWVNGTATNYGVILWATNEDTDGMNLWFRSSEYSDSNFHPRLEVTWSQTLQAVYFLKDHLGSIRATVLDSVGAPILGYDDYDPWGYPLAQRAKPIPSAYLQGGSKIKFTGKEYDDELGLNLAYFGARYYDWLRGQWISVEPLAMKYPWVSPYAYSLNNPVVLYDPDGKKVEFIGTKEQKARWEVYKNYIMRSPTGNALYGKLDSDKKTYYFRFGSLPEDVLGKTTVAATKKHKTVENKKVISDAKLVETKTMIDETKTLNDKEGPSVDGVIVHELQHVEDARDNPQKFLTDLDSEEALPYDERPQEKRAEETRKKVEQELKDEKAKKRKQ